MGNYIFCWPFLIFKIFKILTIRDSSLIAMCTLNILFKTNRFYLSNCLRGSVSRKPLLLPKTGKTWRHSDVINGQRIKPSEFFFCQDVSNWWLRGYWKFCDDLYVTSGDIAEKREGGGQKIAPPVGRGLTLKQLLEKYKIYALNFSKSYAFVRKLTTV